MRWCGADAPQIASPCTREPDAAAPRIGRDEERYCRCPERRGEMHEPRVDADDKFRAREEGRERRQRLPRRRRNARIVHAGGKALAARVLGTASPRQDDGEARGGEHLDQAPPVRVGPQLVRA